MREFNIIKPSAEASYWFELASFTAPFANAGSFIFSAISFFSDDEQQPAVDKLAAKLDEISQQIADLQQLIIQKLDDVVLKERSGEILGIKESLDEYTRLQSQGILDNVITNSAETKRKILTYLRAPQTPLEFLHSYNSLMCALIPLRVASFFFFKRPFSDIKVLVIDEINDLLSGAAAALAVANVIGRNRVSYQEQIFLVDEMGPVWGTDFIVEVDGTAVFTDTFMPHSHNLNTIRALAHQKKEEFAVKEGLEVARPLQECYDNAKKILDAFTH